MPSAVDSKSGPKHLATGKHPLELPDEFLQRVLHHAVEAYFSALTPSSLPLKRKDMRQELARGSVSENVVPSSALLST